MRKLIHDFRTNRILRQMSSGETAQSRLVDLHIVQRDEVFHEVRRARQ
jgi:hypothetical protein